MGVVFLDCETTGLDPDRHQIWELALIVDEIEHLYRFKVDLTKADPTGLRIGRYYERAPRSTDPFTKDKARGWWNDPRYRAPEIARRLDGRHLVGAVPSFDAAFLTRWLNKWGEAATWHYHLIDVEALAVGYLALGGPMKLPWNSESLSEAVGVDPSQFDRHTALGDARWAKAIYEAVMGK